MPKKSLIIGIALVICGFAVKGWIFNEQKKEQLQLEQQRQRSKTVIETIEKQFGDKAIIATGAGGGYDANAQKSLDSFQKQDKDKVELAATVYAFCFFTGGTLLGWLVMVEIVKILINTVPSMQKISEYSCNPFVFLQRNDAKQKAESGKDSAEKSVLPKRVNKRDKATHVIKDSGWINSMANAAFQHDQPIEANIYFPENDTVKNTAATSSQNPALEKQIAEFGLLVQDIHKKTCNQPANVDNILRELNEQMSAIRNYATQQQERVEKLQEGYDWNIIKKFCLRIIRCLDNISSRIEHLTEQSIDTTELQQIQDEIIFVLESSGVEQYWPEINSLYRGQERTAEVMKDKEYSEDAEMNGKIAKIIRCGYQYCISDKNIKIVRPAVVKLFGESKTGSFK